MDLATALQIGLNPGRHTLAEQRPAYDLLVNLPDSQITREWYAAVGNLESALRRHYA